MSTEYELEFGKCKCCGSNTRLVIGVSAGVFYFAGYEKGTLPSHPEAELISYQNWYNFIKESEGEIIDEFGKKVSLEEFCTLIESGRHESYPQDFLNRSGGYLNVKTWLDADKFGFTAYREKE